MVTGAAAPVLDLQEEVPAGGVMLFRQRRWKVPLGHFRPSLVRRSHGMVTMVQFVHAVVSTQYLVTLVSEKATIELFC